MEAAAAAFFRHNVCSSIQLLEFLVQMVRFQEIVGFIATWNFT
jgi:hypothetical protein